MFLQLNPTVIQKKNIYYANYHYIIKPAVAMSGCVAVGDRLSVLEGIVKDIKHNEQGYYVVVEFDE